jgi:hypothetical protein
MSEVSEKLELANKKESKINEIKKLTNILFDVPADSLEKNLPLVDHANFLHRFSEYGLQWNQLIPAYFIKDHMNNTSDKSFAVVTEISKKNKDEITIVRKHFFNNYYNETLSTEKISIKRKFEKKESLVFKSLKQDKFKKEVITLDADGLYSRLVKFKYFRNPREFLFYQNIYYYKCMEEIYGLYKLLNLIPPKQKLEPKDLKYYDFIRNFL